jgi:hypothetical protein
MGGVGKTQVAVEYTYRYRDSYDFIFWIHAENEAVLVSSITKISNGLGLQLAGNATITGAVVDCVRKWLEKTSIVPAVSPPCNVLIMNTPQISDGF